MLMLMYFMGSRYMFPGTQHRIDTYLYTSSDIISRITSTSTPTRLQSPASLADVFNDDLNTKLRPPPVNLVTRSVSCSAKKGTSAIANRIARRSSSSKRQCTRAISSTPSVSQGGLRRFFTIAQDSRGTCATPTALATSIETKSNEISVQVKPSRLCLNRDHSDSTRAVSQVGCAQGDHSCASSENRNHSNQYHPNFERIQTTVDPSAAAHEWQRIQQKMTPPKCRGHKEPCKVRVVKKPGPNFGRIFYCCPRPAGPRTNPEADCSFFAWAYDRTHITPSSKAETS
mmetsp:Transcript_27615/g.52571  ORF Transcript_27615/g.52571 Transcript_27615/m.52571 type:complete len:286 (-) Transcript_27615:375-1232(-)